MEIIGSLKEEMKSLKGEIWWSLIMLAILGTCTLYSAHKSYMPYAILCIGVGIGILLMVLTIMNIVRLKKTEDHLSLWQGVEDGKYKHLPKVKKLYDDLEKAETGFRNHRWNMNTFESQAKKLQKKIEATLLNK